MGTVYHPDPNSDTPRGNARKAIVDTTNATPIKVKVTAHGYATGDAVEIEGAQDPNADGTWLITFVDADHFTLDGSVGTLAGGAIGTASNWTTLPFGTMADDGDPVDSVTLMSPLENVNNFVPYATQRLGRWRIVDLYAAAANDAGGPVAGTIWSNNASAGTAAWLNAAGMPLLAYGVQPAAVAGDILDVTVTTSCIIAVNAAAVALSVYGAGGAITKIAGSEVLIPAGYVGPVTMKGVHAFLATATPFNIAIVYWDNPAGTLIQLTSDWTCIARHLRANP